MGGVVHVFAFGTEKSQKSDSGCEGNEGDAQQAVLFDPSVFKDVAYGHVCAQYPDGREYCRGEADAPVIAWLIDTADGVAACSRKYRAEKRRAETDAPGQQRHDRGAEDDVVHQVQRVGMQCQGSDKTEIFVKFEDLVSPHTSNVYPFSVCRNTSQGKRICCDGMPQDKQKKEKEDQMSVAQIGEYYFYGIS